MGTRYTNQNMNDPQFQYPNRYTITPIQGASGNYNIVRNPGSSANSSATPISGPNMQRLETAVETIDNDLKVVENNYAKSVNNVNQVNHNITLNAVNIPAVNPSDSTNHNVQFVLNELWDTLFNLSGGGLSVTMANSLYWRLDGDDGTLVNGAKWTSSTGSGLAINNGVVKLLNNNVSVINSSSTETGLFSPAGDNAIHVQSSQAVSSKEVYVGSVSAPNKLIKRSELPVVPDIPDVPTYKRWTNQPATKKLRINITDTDGYVKMVSTTQGAGTCNNVKVDFGGVVSPKLSYFGKAVTLAGVVTFDEINDTTTHEITTSMGSNGEIVVNNEADIQFSKFGITKLKGTLTSRLSHQSALVNTTRGEVINSLSTYDSPLIWTEFYFDLSHSGSSGDVFIEYQGCTVTEVDLSARELLASVENGDMTVEYVKEHVTDKIYNELTKLRKEVK